MNRKGCILGIDLGTSSVKLLLCKSGRSFRKVREAYITPDPEGWKAAVLDALRTFSGEEIDAIGLSSQVGTYIIDGKDVIPWYGAEGKEELAEIKTLCTPKEFQQEISMPHPEIISYPLPRLLYIRRHFPGFQKVCQPKDLICEMLTGRCATDQWSMRGLANLKKGTYSQKLLKLIQVPETCLPEIVGNEVPAGYTKENGIASGLLPAGIPVFAGMNDFYASLLGMGITDGSEFFDITGTSEHLGLLTDKVSQDAGLISGPFVTGNVLYGVTASSGASISWGQRMFPADSLSMKKCLHESPPVFLPYVNGERSPLYDADARGMFAGISSSCTPELMAYAVYEGIAFSLCHIRSSFSFSGPSPARMKISGGAAGIRILNELKAALFGIPVLRMAEDDTSALGACIIAACGMHEFRDYAAASDVLCRIESRTEPSADCRDLLLKRFAVYKDLITAAQSSGHALRRIGK